MQKERTILFPQPPTRTKTLSTAACVTGIRVDIVPGDGGLAVVSGLLATEKRN